MDIATLATKTYSNASNARRAARAAGIADDQIRIEQTDDGYVVGMAAEAAQDAPEAPAVTDDAPEVAPAADEAPTAASGPKEGTAAYQCLVLAQRPEGATTVELNQLTGWKGAPWRWLFTNPKGTGWADRAGLRVVAGKVGRTAVYKVAS